VVAPLVAGMDHSVYPVQRKFILRSTRAQFQGVGTMWRRARARAIRSILSFQEQAAGHGPVADGAGRKR